MTAIGESTLRNLDHGDNAINPDGARIGQVECRAEAGTTIGTNHFTQFDDTCTHLHIDVGFTDGQLTAR